MQDRKEGKEQWTQNLRGCEIEINFNRAAISSVCNLYIDMAITILRCFNAALLNPETSEVPFLRLHPGRVQGRGSQHLADVLQLVRPGPSPLLLLAGRARRWLGRRPGSGPCPGRRMPSGMTGIIGTYLVIYLSCYRGCHITRVSTFQMPSSVQQPTTLKYYSSN